MRIQTRRAAYIIENADLTLLITHDLISEYANFGDLIDEALTLERRNSSANALHGKPGEGFVDWQDFLDQGEQVGNHD